MLSCFQLVQHCDDALQLLFVLEGDGNLAFTLGVAGELHIGLEECSEMILQQVIFVRFLLLVFGVCLFLLFVCLDDILYLAHRVAHVLYLLE